MTMLREITPHQGRPKKFTPANLQKIKDWVAEGISREEIAKSLDVTIGSLQVTCSRLGISLRTPKMFERRTGVESRPYLPNHPPIAGQRHTGTGFQISLILECNGTRRTTELPLTTSAIGHLKLEAEIRNLSMGQLLAEIAGMAIKKGMIEEILHKPTQERAAPLQPENS
jgi:hypothetical protein